MRKAIIFTFLSIFIISGLFAQVVDLNDVINKQVTLNANGNGSSSGFSVDGFIHNFGSRNLRISTAVKNGLYLKNSGAGQNMVVIAVYEEDGSYFVDGKYGYIELKALTRTPVSFIAFCADFDRDNPSSKESFSVAAMPAGIKEIAAKISRYAADHDDDDLTRAGQLALWFAQGETASSISAKFDFDSDDEAIAGQIASY